MGLVTARIPGGYLTDAPYVYGLRDASQSCQDALTDALLDLDGIANAFYVLSTGKYLDNWGAYGACLDSAADGTYWLASVSGESAPGAPTTTFRTGLCVPDACKESDLKFLDSIFVESAEFNNMTNPQVTYDNVNAYMDVERSLSAGRLSFFGVLLAWIGLVGVGTIVTVTGCGNKEEFRRDKNTTTEDDRSEPLMEEESKEGEEEEHEVRVEEQQRSDLDDMADSLDSDTMTLHKKKAGWTVFLPFSATRSMGKVLSNQRPHYAGVNDVKREERPMRVLDGMKFWAMLFLAVGNSYLFATYFVVANTKDLPEFYKEFFFTLIPFAFFALDATLFISAIIATYNFLKMPEMTVGGVMKAILTRFLRFMFLVAVVMGVSIWAVSILVEGPMGHLYAQAFDTCKTQWWTNLLMINNFYPASAVTGESCMWWTWYLSVDMQLFLVAPLLAALLKKSPKLGYSTIALLCGCSIAAVAVHDSLISTPGIAPA